jgi:hypothetical protein
VGEPGDHLALAARSMGKLIADEFRNQHRNRTVDLLFASLAKHAKGNAVGVILSGALDDGSSGLAAIHHAGGLTMVLTPADHAATSGMPHSAIGYDGPIDFEGGVGQIAVKSPAWSSGLPDAGDVSVSTSRETFSHRDSRQALIILFTLAASTVSANGFVMFRVQCDRCRCSASRVAGQENYSQDRGRLSLAAMTMKPGVW